MMRSPILRNTIAAGTLVSFTSYAFVVWFPIYLIRIHGMGTGEVGTILALLLGVGGAAGTFAGGWLSDRLAKINQGWRVWVIVLTSVITVPCAIASFLQTDTTLAILFYVLPALLLTVYIGPAFALIQSHTPLEMRSVAAAINLFILNIIGLGLGPFAVGLFSDLFAPSQGIDSLRYAMIAMVPVTIWGMLHFLRLGVLLSRIPEQTLSSDIGNLS